jgi:2-polyprenyl-6-methoxyphenol hydroxylase-like FAD-dependent oxidoreductase
MIQPLRIAIVGYGIGGIAAAIQLRRLDHDITHFERSHPPAARGAGMLLHPSALRELKKLGLLDSVMACGAPVRHICAQTVHGQPLMDLGYPGLLASQHGVGIQRGVLHRLLSDADTGRDAVLSGHSITSLDSQRGYLFGDSHDRYGPYDLIVVADGAHSNLREQMPIFARRNQRADSAALVGLLDDPDRLATDRLVQYFDANRHLSVWPVGSDSPGFPARCSVAMNVSLTEAAAFRDQGGWRSQLAHLSPMIGKLLNDGVDNSDLHIFAYRDVELDTCVAGRAVLIGDAAHCMSPQLGVGAQLAMEDASILASMLAEHRDLPVALRAYTRGRPPMLRRYQQASRWLTPLFQTDNRVLASLRDQLMARTIRAPLVQRLAQELLS